MKHRIDKIILIFYSIFKIHNFICKNITLNNIVKGIKI